MPSAAPAASTGPKSRNLVREFEYIPRCMGQRSRRFLGVLEYVLVATVVALVSLNALAKMDYLNPSTAPHLRMTDHNRTAYVARSIVEGRGYVANDMPSFLIDFYQQRGKLLGEQWTNADRFPFSAYATAALYLVTGSRSYETGILLYNALWFTALWVFLYWCGKAIFGSRYVSIAAIAVALLHPHTWVLLYLKDSDTLLLTALVIAGIWKLEISEGRTSKWTIAGLGTAMGWLFLARPNVGLPFMAFCGVLTIIAMLRERRGGVAKVFRAGVDSYLLVGLVALVWAIPFMAHNLSEWGSPLFSSNGIYQMPLGTRFAMETDTWWKYGPPGSQLSFQSLLHGDTENFTRKFTSSWPITIKLVLAAHGVEIVFAALSAWLMPPSNSRQQRARRIIIASLATAVALNIATLPLFGAQGYNYRHYLAFALPGLWLFAGAGIVGIITYVREPVVTAWAHVKRHLPVYAAVLAIGIFLWNFGARTPDGNSMFARLAPLFGRHWIGIVTVIALVVMRDRVRRMPHVVVAAAIATTLVWVRFAPNSGIKRDNFLWLPATAAVGPALRGGSGVVYAFTMQGESSWLADRRSVMAPENALYLYEIPRAHQLFFGDLYIESAQALNELGWFGRAAPGFETYARIERYLPQLPGYERVFHYDTFIGYPKFRVKPMEKASTIYRLVDKTAVERMWRSPLSINLGDISSTIFQTHGFGDYATVDGVSVVCADRGTKNRHRGMSLQPWEDTSISFLLDRTPKEVQLRLYAPAPTTLTFYWNLDLFAYDLPDMRSRHEVKAIEITAPGWSTISIPVPAGVARSGLNKLGFRSSSFSDTTICVSEHCEQQPSELAEEPSTWTALPKREFIATKTGQDYRTKMSVLLSSLDFVY